jgi:hypothetical protein
MKQIICILFLLVPFTHFGQVEYTDYFKKSALRIDFVFGGTSENETIYLKQLKEEPKWGGSGKYLITPMEYGGFKVVLKDQVSGKTIYSRGFSTLFEEWQTTDEATETNKSFYHSIRTPYPKVKVTLQIMKRKYKDGEFYVLYEKDINPDDYFILHENPIKVEVDTIYKGGDPARSVDLAFIAEGYTSAEMEKFNKDVRRMMEYFYENKPIGKYKDRFNVYAVHSISQETGTDVPGKDIYKNTALNSSYYTFDIPRYLTVKDSKEIRDYAANVPYDHILILINTRRYGGGGIYNHFTASTTDHLYSKQVTIHEFGHGFAGLGDEYYNSEVAYNDLYNLEVEPWEPNITTLVDFESKWKDMIREGVPVPTPRKEEFNNTIGLFEGGGYMTKGIYSPYMDCRMKSNSAGGFCPVCQEAIERMIQYYIGEMEKK